MMNRRDLLGRLIGTIGFGIFSSKSCIDYLQARELEQPQRKEYVDVYCRIFNEERYFNRKGWLPPLAKRLSYQNGVIVLKFEASVMDNYWFDVVEPLDKIGLAIDSVSPVYVEYV